MTRGRHANHAYLTLDHPAAHRDRDDVHDLAGDPEPLDHGRGPRRDPRQHRRGTLRARRDPRRAGPRRVHRHPRRRGRHHRRRTPTTPPPPTCCVDVLGDTPAVQQVLAADDFPRVVTAVRAAHAAGRRRPRDRPHGRRTAPGRPHRSPRPRSPTRSAAAPPPAPRPDPGWSPGSSRTPPPASPTHRSCTRSASGTSSSSTAPTPSSTARSPPTPHGSARIPRHGVAPGPVAGHRPARRRLPRPLGHHRHPPPRPHARRHRTPRPARRPPPRHQRPRHPSLDTRCLETQFQSRLQYGRPHRETCNPKIIRTMRDQDADRTGHPRNRHRRYKPADQPAKRVTTKRK